MHLSSSSSSYRKGVGWGGRGPEQPVLIFGHLGEYSGTFSLLASRFPLFPTLLLCFLTTYDTKKRHPPVHFLASGPPPTRSRGPGFHFPDPFIPPCQTRSRTRRDEGEGKDGIFHPSGSGGTGGPGVEGRGGVSMGDVGGRECRCRKRKTTPFLPLGQNLLQKFLTFGMGVGGRGGGDWHGQARGAYLHGFGVKGRSSRCLLATNKKYQPNWVVSLSCLNHGETGQARIKYREEKETEGKPQGPTSSLPQREATPSFKRLETRRLLVQSLLLITSGIIIQIFSQTPSPRPSMITRVVPYLLFPRRPPCVV